MNRWGSDGRVEDGGTGKTEGWEKRRDGENGRMGETEGWKMEEWKEGGRTGGKQMGRRWRDGKNGGMCDNNRKMEKDVKKVEGWEIKGWRKMERWEKNVGMREIERWGRDGGAEDGGMGR